MTDRELLAMAAKATLWLTRPDGYGGYLIGPDTGGWKQWNPLTDDGDALRLAVKLGLHVRAYPIYLEPKHSVLVQKSAITTEGHCIDVAVATCAYDDSDPYAATRRAIVRAAAEIGRQMP